MTDQVVPPPSPPRSRTSRGWRILRWVLIGLGQLALIAAAVSVALYLANRRIEPENTSIEAQWDSAIKRLGIEPVYPPQEDIAVGDVFVTVVADARLPLKGQTNASQRPFLGKSVKLGHADVAKTLEATYRAMPLFYDNASANQAAPPAGSGAPEPTLFGTHAERSELPRAAFPGLTITNEGSAGTGLAGSTGWFNFGASRAASQRLVLKVVETYGLYPADAEAALDTFCKQSTTQDLCTDAGARKYLRSLLAEACETHFDADTKEQEYDLTIQVIMISRIFMAREILEEWSSLVSEGGGAEAALAAAGEAAKPSDLPKSAGEAGNPLEQRLEAVEREVNNLRPGGAAVYRSSAGTDILLDQKFPRPVAVGYRSIAHKFAAEPNSGTPCS